MDREALSERLGTIFRSWVDDPESDVVATELVEGRWAVRMAQRTRDFTTVWAEPGELTVGFEAYVLPPPPREVEEVFRQLLFRNHTAWRVHFAIDKNREIYLRGRLPVEAVDEESLLAVFGEIYQLIELAFRPLIAAGYRRAGAPGAT